MLSTIKILLFEFFKHRQYLKHQH